MRKRIFDRSLSVALLALIAAASTPLIAAPDRAESFFPLLSLFGEPTPHHRNAAAPPPHRHVAPIPKPKAQAPAAAIAPPAAQVPVEPRAADKAVFAIEQVPDEPLATSDTQIAGSLRVIVTANEFEQRMLRAPERKAIEAFYAARNYAPLWIGGDRLTAKAKATIALLQHADVDGLDASDYPVPEFTKLPDAKALAEGDITLTASVLTFARHLATGRIAPTRVSADVDYGNHTPDPADVLQTIAGAGDANAALDGFNPPHDGFRALKAKLAELRRGGGQADNRIPPGPAIKPGATDARVPALRERLGIKGRPDNHVYDMALSNAIRQLQHGAGLKPTGIVDGKTLAVINGPKPSLRIDRVLANMERWRWLPHDLGRTYVMVNIPDFTLKVVSNNNPLWRTRIVAGKPQTPTPLTTASMDSIVVNPSWHVPQSIIQNELLPLSKSDPNIFTRLGLEAKRTPDGQITVVQPPGARNALGRIKFNFPNKFQVYLHDTPEKRLFTASHRAFSHGCMRVEDPTKFGEVMLHLTMNGQTPDSRRLFAMFGQKEFVFRLVKRPMVHLTYQTAFVDSGRLVVRDDIYGFDARIHTILHSDERRISDVAPPQDPKRDLATMKSNQEILSRVERREALNPGMFFERPVH